MEKTRNYDMFIFKDDNREKGVDRGHVEKLKASIKSHNLLHLKPINVNGRMEIIDGQHRLTAAKELGLEIYYIKDESMKDEDFLNLNVVKNLTHRDYFHYYCKHHYPEYLKLEAFMKKNNLSLSVALSMLQGGTHNPRRDFKAGKFVFEEQAGTVTYDLCWQTIHTIERLLGVNQWTKSSKFWKAMSIIFNHPYFSQDKWFKNLNMFISKVTQKVSTMDYVNLFKEIHNFRNQSRIDEIGLSTERVE